MRHLILVVALLLYVATGLCNETALVQRGGQWQTLSGRHASVDLLSERVRMDVQEEFYDVDVVFRFQNTGAAAKVTMGVPEVGNGYSRHDRLPEQAGYQSCMAWVDGKPVSTQRVTATITDWEAPTGYILSEKRPYWIQQVAFKRGQFRTVRVRYKAPIRGIMGDCALYYLTGANWHNVLHTTTLEIIVQALGTRIVGASFNGSMLPLEQNNNHFLYNRNSWGNRTEKDVFVFSSRPTVPNWMLLGDQREGPFGIEEQWHYTVTRPGQAKETFSSGSTNVHWLAPALLKDQTAFIYLGELAAWLSRQGYKAGSEATSEIVINNEAKTWTLKAGDHLIRFPIGEARMEVNGKSIALPAPSFDAAEQMGRNFGGGRIVYVPAKAVLQALGGTTRIDGKTRRLHITAPAFWKTAPIVAVQTPKPAAKQ